MTAFLRIATEIGELVEQKNAAYGSSFADAGAFLRLLYPQGLAPVQYDDALLTVRIYDKLKRIATDRDALGESPYRDIAGYGILGAALVDSKREDACQPPTQSLPRANRSTDAASGAASRGTSTSSTKSSAPAAAIASSASAMTTTAASAPAAKGRRRASAAGSHSANNAAARAKTAR